MGRFLDSIQEYHLVCYLLLKSGEGLAIPEASSGAVYDCMKELGV